MEITEVRIKLMDDSDDRLQGFCSITFDDAFVIRDLKIIEGSSGPFVAMPSRKLTGHCHQCGSKNHLKAGYCNHCGVRLREDRLARDVDGRTKLYADIAHPINSACREMIQNRVIAEYRAEQERAKMPGYVSRYDDDYEDDHHPAAHGPESRRESRHTNHAPVAPPAVPTPAPAIQTPIATTPPNIPLPPGSHVEPAETVIRAPHMLPHRARPSHSQPASQTPASSSLNAPTQTAERPAESRAPETGHGMPAPHAATKQPTTEQAKPPRGPGEFGAGIF